MKRKTVLITGASRGIGRQTALAFSKNGYHVFLNCYHHPEALLSVKEQIDQAHNTCTMVAGNVSDPNQVHELFKKIYRECEALDVLINNAGISKIGLLTDLSNHDWDQIIQTNFSSAFYCCREAIPPMVSRKSGKIINISSMWGSQGASCEVAYSASKSGLHGFTKALAKELAPSNISVNAIAFGAINTSMNDWMSLEEKRALEKEIPAQRLGTVSEAADCIYNIAQCPSYLTGQIIGVDGGY